MLIFKTLWLGTCLFFIFTNSNVVADLKFVNLLWRHGARSPIHFFPTDVHNNESVWPQGPGQLTQNGMQQHYQLGIFLRQRYGKLLSSQYDRSEIYVRSTDLDRTLQSAQCNLAGLYNLTGIQKWNGSVYFWQPIPVHTVAKDHDNLLLFPPNEKYSEIMKKVWKSPFAEKIKSEHKEFFQEIRKFSGLTNMSGLDAVSRVHDVLICEKAQGLSWPHWATPRRWKVIRELSDVQMGLSFGAGTSYRTPIGKLRGGVLMKQIIDNMRSNINQSQPYKVVAYSAHDTTLTSILTETNVFNHVNYPTFASCFMFELHENATSNGTEYFVKTFYRRPETDLFVQLNIFGCGMECPLSKLEKIVFVENKDNKPNSSDVDELKDGSEFTTIAMYAVLFLLLTAFLVVIGKVICRIRVTNNDRINPVYQPLSSNGEEA